MKNCPAVQSGFVLAALSFILPLTCLTAASAKEEVLVDLTDIRKDHQTNEVFRQYEYAFGSWEKKITDMPGRGALVQAPSGQGGLGENKTAVSFKGLATVEVVFIIGNANKAGSMNFSLEDKDGTECFWNIPIGQLGRGREQRFQIDLKNPTSVSKPGKTEGLNLAKINTWQLKGDWTAPSIEVLLIKIVAPK